MIEKRKTLWNSVWIHGKFKIVPLTIKGACGKMKIQ